MACSVVHILRSIVGGRLTLRTLGEVELRHNECGEVIYSVGNSAILFSFWHFEGWHTLKCYTSKSSRRRAIYGQKLLTDELYIPIEGRHGEWIDILLEEWIEGVTLSQYIKEAVEANSSETIATLSQRFDSLALELLSLDWAHGDISCDNIIVDSSGGLHLIDFDGAYLPEFEGSESLELGTAAYQHPSRTTSHFNRSIDDYSLALISTALTLLRLDVSLYERYQTLEGLLFDPSELLQGCSEIYSIALDHLAKAGEALSYRVAELLSSQSVELDSLHTLMHYKVEGVHPAAEPTTIFCRDGLWGYLNEYRREVIPPLFDAAFDFSESLAAVRIGSSWHYIDSCNRVRYSAPDCRSLKSPRGGVGRMLLASGEWQEISIEELKR